MNAPLLQVRALGKRFGGFVALSGIDVSVARAERVGLIGPNGSGKSTFVNCLGGFFGGTRAISNSTARPSNGVPAYRRAKLGLARTFQLPRAFASLTVAENVEIPLRFLGSDGPIYVRAREGSRARGPCGQGEFEARGIDASGSSPPRACPCACLPPEAADRRRSHGGSLARRRSTRSWRCCSQSTPKEWRSS